MQKITKILFCGLMLTLSSYSFADSVKEKSSESNTQSILNNAIHRVDINSADVKTLSVLKGIGRIKAQAIVKYREINGKFTSVDDLLNVNGIGKQILTMNKEMLSL